MMIEILFDIGNVVDDEDMKTETGLPRRKRFGADEVLHYRLLLGVDSGKVTDICEQINGTRFQIN